MDVSCVHATPRVDTVSSCDVYLIVVPVGLDDTQRVDYTHLDSAVKLVASVLLPGDLVVVEATVPVGTTRNRVLPSLCDLSGLPSGTFHVASSPERIMTGYSMSRFESFPKVVGGVDGASGLAAYKFYSSFLDARRVSSSETAEMTKIAEGVYRDVNIAIANELKYHCDLAGVSYDEMAAAADHEFCHLHLPGLVGGHCIPVYPRFLGYQAKSVIYAARFYNESRVRYWANRIAECGATVCIKGISYRFGVKSIVNSKPLDLYHMLHDMRVPVGVWDAQYDREEIEGLGLKWMDPTDADIVFDPYELEFR